MVKSKQIVWSFLFVSLHVEVAGIRLRHRAAAALWAQKIGSHALFLAAFGGEAEGLNSLLLARRVPFWDGFLFI